MLNFEVASCSSFRVIKKNHFVTTEAAADIDDSIKRKRIRVSLKMCGKLKELTCALNTYRSDIAGLSAMSLNKICGETTTEGHYFY